MTKEEIKYLIENGFTIAEISELAERKTEESTEEKNEVKTEEKPEESSDESAEEKPEDSALNLVQKLSARFDDFLKGVQASNIKKEGDKEVIDTPEDELYRLL